MCIRDRDYPFSETQALEKIRAAIPEFTEAEFHAMVDDNKIDWIYVHGEPHYFLRFYQTLIKTDAAFAARAGVVNRDVYKRQAESYYLDHAIVIPLLISGGSYQATKLNGFEGQFAMMGQSSSRYKGQHVYKTAMSQDMYDAQYEEWYAAMGN